jgi:hypothetical protein
MDRYFLYCLQQASLALNEERAILLAQLAGNHAMTVDTPLTTVTPASYASADTYLNNPVEAVHDCSAPRNSDRRD